MLFCKRVTKTIGRRRILENITMEINPGECVCISGDAGSGKTTLFELLITASKPTSGSIEIDGVPIGNLPPLILQLLRMRMGIVFQEPQLLSDLTIRENIGYPLMLQGMNDQSIERRVNDVLKRLGLLDRAECLPEDISFSERTLAGIARAFVAQPIMIIADEPFHALDAAQVHAAIELFREVHAAGATIILFTSNAALPSFFSARTLTLARGTIEEYNESSSQKDQERHRIFESPPSVPVKTSAAEGKRKVRITSIGP